MNPEARWIEAWALIDAGKADEAAVILREQASIGDVSCMRTLADLLTEAGSTAHREGLGWYRRAAAEGDSIAAWNCAMTWRMSGNRRRYRHWVETAARLGEDQAAVVMAEIGRRRAAGRRWPMFKTSLIDVDAEDIADMLRAMLDGEVTGAEVRDWADGVACGDLPSRPELRERWWLRPILEELARGDIRAARARELLFALNPD